MIRFAITGIAHERGRLHVSFFRFLNCRARNDQRIFRVLGELPAERRLQQTVLAAILVTERCAHSQDFRLCRLITALA